MKNVLIILFVCQGLFSLAQSYSPSSNWPYIYPEFIEGNVILKSGEKSVIPINIHLKYNQLHYIDGENIKQLPLEPVVRVEVNNEVYISVENSLVKLLKAKESGFLGVIKKGDFSILNETGGAYGVSSNTQSTTKNTSIQLGLATDPVNVINYIALRNEEKEGKIIPVKEKYCLVINHKLYPATKKGIEKELSQEQQAEFKKFVKANKIKWKEEDSLFILLDFFNENNL